MPYYGVSADEAHRKLMVQRFIKYSLPISIMHSMPLA